MLLNLYHKLFGKSKYGEVSVYAPLNGRLTLTNQTEQFREHSYECRLIFNEHFCIQEILIAEIVDFHFSYYNSKEVKSTQRSGTEAVRTQILPSKPKREKFK